MVKSKTREGNKDSYWKSEILSYSHDFLWLLTKEQVSRRHKKGTGF